MNIEQKLINFIENNKQEENGYIQYYWNNKEKCDQIWRSFDKKIEENDIKCSLIMQDFQSIMDFLDDYLNDTKICVEKKNQLTNKLNKLDIETEISSDGAVIIFENINLRAQRPIYCTIEIDNRSNIVQIKTTLPPIRSQASNKELGDRSCYNEWEKDIGSTLFGNVNYNIKFEVLTKSKIKNLYFSIFDLLSRDYITTEYSSSMEADFMPCKISSLEEVIQNEKEIQYKKKNNIPVYDHVDISFPFEERLMWWFRNLCNNNSEKKRYFKLSSGYPYGFLNKMQIDIDFGFEEADHERFGNMLFKTSRYAFIIEGYGENTTIGLYEGKKKRKNCLLKEAKNFPNECFKYLEKEVQSMIDNKVLKLLLKHFILKSLIIKPLKEKFGDRVKNVKLIFSGPVTTASLEKQLIPLKLKKSGTVFDLSNIQNPHIIENYDEAFVAATEQNILHSISNPGKSIRVNAKKRL